jgi:hypothetical protein
VRGNAHKSKERDWIPEKYFEAFHDALDNYERAHPHWRIEVLASLIKWGIRNLKHSIEEEPGSQITWDNPLVELHYLVEWDWNAPRDGDKIYGRQVLGKLTKENTSNRKVAAKTLAGMMACRFNTMALEHFTNGAWFEKRENTYVPYLPANLDTSIKQVKGKWKKREELEEIYKPFWIGTTRVGIPGSGLKKNSSIPRRVAKQLEAIGQRMDIPAISFSGQVNGRKMWSGLVFEIQPLIIDYDAHRAYYPVTTGLAFEHRLAGNDVIALTPSGWPRKDREAFWDRVLRGVDESIERLVPKNETQSSIILLRNGEILKVQPLHCRGDMGAPRRLPAGFQRRRQEQEASAKECKRRLHLLRACDLAITADEKGRALEQLAAELFNTVPGLRVVNSNVRTETEEIDLVISHDATAREFKDEAEFILVECKKWSAKCGKDEFVLFEKKIHNRRGRSSLGFLISWNGFTDTFKKEMLRGSHERPLVVPLDGDQIRSAAQRGTFPSLLASARRDAIFL